MADGSTETTEIPTALYRHFDASGRLLYVGISLSPTYRLSQHRVCSPWFSQIANITVEWLPNRLEALKAERSAIQSEGPEYNKTHRMLEQIEDEAPASLAEASRIELVREFARFRSAYSMKGAADATGLREPSIRLALMHRDLRFIDDGSRVVISGWSLIEYMEALEAGAIKARRLERQPDGSWSRTPNFEEIRAGCYLREA